MKTPPKPFRNESDAIGHRTRVSKADRILPEGLDNWCGDCLVPYTYKNAKTCGAKKWRRFCCRTCQVRAEAKGNG